MTLEEFAKKAGVRVVLSMYEDGCFDYQVADSPNTTIGWFRTKDKAYRFWLIETFGKRTAAVIRKLLKEEEK
jgi:hypothetical protein